MKHQTYLVFDGPEFGRTYTARCRVHHGRGRTGPCPWTVERLALGNACEAALRHETDTVEKVPT